MVPELIVVMSVYGCGDQIRNCDYISQAEPVWATREACEQAVPAVIEQHKSHPYPVITARCERKQSEEEQANEALRNAGVARPPVMFEILREKAEQADLDIANNLRSGFERTHENTVRMLGTLGDWFSGLR